MTAKYLWATGSGIFIVLGAIHLFYTFFTDKFSVRDRSVGEKMKSTYPVLTTGTTMWKAWLSFNASHSIGAIYFGGLNLLLAVVHFNWLSANPVLIIITNAVSLFYVFLGIRYWFNIPRTGAILAAICYLASTVIIMIK